MCMHDASKMTKNKYNYVVLTDVLNPWSCTFYLICNLVMHTSKFTTYLHLFFDSSCFLVSLISHPLQHSLAVLISQISTKTVSTMLFRICNRSWLEGFYDSEGKSRSWTQMGVPLHSMFFFIYLVSYTRSMYIQNRSMLYFSRVGVSRKVEIYKSLDVQYKVLI